jgi:DNA topoisomerase I
VKYGAKYVSLKTDDPYEISPERALEVIREKEIADANRLILDFPEAKIQVLNGRYGPYITDKERNAKIPKDKDPKSLSLEECQTLLAAAPVRTFGKWGKKNAKGTAGKGASKGQNGRKASKAEAPAAAPADAGAVAGTTGTKRSAGARAPSRKGAAATGAPLKLAARATNPAANKKAPVESLGQPATPTKAKPKAQSAKLKARKSPEKRKS